MSEKLEGYKLKCKTYLSTIDIHRLRGYGRSIGVARPTAKGKEELIEDIVAILAFELVPIPISKRGAPVKNDAVDEAIPNKLEAIKAECFAGTIMMDLPEYDFEEEYRKVMIASKYNVLRLNDPGKDTAEILSSIHSRGQISFEGEECVLLPLDGSIPEDHIPVPAPLIEEFKLRDGDYIVCNLLEKQGAKKVGKIAAIDNILVACLQDRDRPHFEDCHAQYSKERYKFVANKQHKVALCRTMNWLYPISKGQRCCVVSAPKAGKTKMLLELANAISSQNSEIDVFVLLVDQTPETVAEFRREYGELGLVSTTYEDDADRQVFVADMVLKRAKRFAEFGRDVVIFVDSLSALARAFNDTEASIGGKTLPCGLEVKTLHYLKKYLGTARSLEEGGSITIIGTVNAETGNPMDDIIARELAEFATLKLELNEGLALRRVYPAIDFEKTQAKYNAMIKSEEENQLDATLHNSILPRVGLDGVLNMLKEAPSKVAFMEKIKNFDEK